MSSDVCIVPICSDNITGGLLWPRLVNPWQPAVLLLSLPSLATGRPLQRASPGPPSLTGCFPVGFHQGQASRRLGLGGKSGWGVFSCSHLALVSVLRKNPPQHSPGTVFLPLGSWPGPRGDRSRRTVAVASLWVSLHPLCGCLALQAVVPSKTLHLNLLRRNLFPRLLRCWYRHSPVRASRPGDAGSWTLPAAVLCSPAVTRQGTCTAKFKSRQVVWKPELQHQVQKSGRVRMDFCPYEVPGGSGSCV